MSRELFFSPSLSEHRTLIITEISEDDAASGYGVAGEWEYCWKGLFEVGGFHTSDAAREAAMREAAERWPDLVPADGTENAYGTVRVYDEGI